MGNPSGSAKSALTSSAIATLAAFGAYFAMYAFRKPFTAAAYPGTWFGIDLKTAAVAAQVLGYTASKFVGIAVIAGMRPAARAGWLLGLVGFAELALLGFAVVPAPWNVLCLFLNGLPLGMVFGLVLGFLEGRRHTEAMAAGLCTSFILADGMTKSLGAWLLARGVAAPWMPVVAGALFAPLLVACVALLARTPPPSEADVRSRAERVPMTRADRRAFLARHGVGLGMLVFAYLALTVLRSIRADFAPELWRELGVGIVPALFTTSETLVALGVLVANGSLVLVRDNRRAFFAGLGISLFGLALCGAAVVLQRGGALGGPAFMVALGLGLYLPYVAIHTTVFERLVAMTRDRGNIGYLMYLADAFGYLGYVGVMFGRAVLREQTELLEFLQMATLGLAGLAAVAFVVAWRWFARRTQSPATAESAAAVALVKQSATMRQT